VDKQSAPANDILTYTLSYTNNGTQTFTQLQIVDPLPPNTTFDSANNGGQLNAGSVRFNLPVVGPGSSGNVSFRVRINQGVQPGTIISNQGRIGGPEVPQAVNSNTVSTTVAQQQINLQLTKQVDKPNAPANDVLTYTLSFVNNGPQTFNQLQIVDPLPANTTFVSADNGGQVNAGAVQWQLPQVGPGGSGVVSFRVRINQNVQAGTVISNQGRIGGPEVPQAINSNTVSTTVSPAQVLLSLTKQVDKQSAPAGELLTYTLNYANNGTQTFNQLQIVDPLPPNTTFDQANNNGQQVAGSVRFNLPVVGPGGSGSVSFRVKINPATVTGTVITNQAQIGGPEVSQPVASNTVNTTVAPPSAAPLTLSKQVNKTTAAPGETLTYTISYTNTSGQTFTQLQLGDTLPAWTAFVDADNGGQLVGGAVRWQLPSVPPGGSGMVSFRVGVNPVAPQATVITNLARLSGPELAQAITSNTVSTTVGQPQQVNLTLTKQVDKQSAVAGDTLTYTINYANNGTQQFTQLQIVDPLPPNTTFLNADNNGQQNAGSVRWQLPFVGPGGNGSVSFQVQINQGANGSTISNQAQIGGPEVSQAVPSNTVSTAVGGGPPQTSFAGTWFAVPPTDHAVSLTVDSQNRFTVWAVSKDRTTVARSAQGHINNDGSFAAASTDSLVQFTGQISADKQSAMITAQRTGFVSFSVTAPRAPDVGPLPDNLVGTWNGFGQAANGDRLQVAISIDPGGNSTFQATMVPAGAGITRLQFAHFYITPDGRITDPNTNQQVGTLQVQGNQVVLNYNFQSSNPTPYQNNFQVQLQQLP
jgi:uncharacterized repeat protein (TIGR01451 family)